MSKLAKAGIVKDPEIFKVMHRLIHACEFCTSPQDTEVAHIYPRQMGGGSRDDSWDNLIMLCRECHHLFDGKLNRRQRQAVQDALKWLLRQRPPDIQDEIQAEAPE